MKDLVTLLGASVYLFVGLRVGSKVVIFGGVPENPRAPVVGLKFLGGFHGGEESGQFGLDATRR